MRIVPSPRDTASCARKAGVASTSGSGLPSTSSVTLFNSRAAYALPSAAEIAPSRSTSIPSRTLSATAMPGVRSISSSTRPGSIARRAACRYSSRRCADVTAPAISSATTVSPPPVLLRRELRTVVVRGIAVDGVDVVDAALLRRILDDERRPLDPEVRRAAVGRRPTPREIRLRQVRPDLRHPRLAERVVLDPCPLANQIEQHRLLRVGERRRADTFRLNRASVLARPEHEVGDAGAEDRLLPLPLVECVDQRERLVVLVAERTDRPPFECVARGLRRRQARRHGRLASRQCQVDGEVMPAELQHPRRRDRRRADEREIVLVLPEAHAAATPSWRSAASARSLTAGRARGRSRRRCALRLPRTASRPT